jgi:hypothetical protein
MKSVSEIKQEQLKKVDELIKEVGMFFAFSTQQFEANKTPLKEGDKYISVGAGGYMPKSQYKNWLDGCDRVDEWYSQAIKQNKARRTNIAYELANHEAYYTGAIDQTLEALGPGYTAEEVLSVFHKERRKQRQ